MAEKGLQGAKELDRQLRELGDGMAAKVIRGALGEALKPTLARAKATIPVGSVPHRTYQGRLVAPGFSQRSIYISTSIRKDRSAASATIGMRKEAFYALAFVEFGVPSRGIPARPWLVPAFNSTRGVMLNALTEALKKRIAKAIAKGGRRR